MKLRMSAGEDQDHRSKVEEALLDVTERIGEVHEDVNESLQAVFEKVGILETRCNACA